jgi:NAD(P)-dependent dehydrogenase (short-subunit alcohol dehydrogenase family)
MHPAIVAGRVAVITGSASGIGLAAARAFASKGLHVVLADLPTNLASAAQSIEKDFPNVKVVSVETDVSQFSALESLKKKVDTEFKGKEVGVLMFNAGTSAQTAPFAREGLDQAALRANYEKILNTNLWGVINGVQAFLPDLVKQTSPSAVICTGSKQVTSWPQNVGLMFSRELPTRLGIQHTISPRRASSSLRKDWLTIFERTIRILQFRCTCLSPAGSILYKSITYILLILRD